MKCSQCGACCIAMSISSGMPLMPHGKPAGVVCIHQDQNFKCRLHDRHDMPQVCRDYQPDPEICTGDLATTLDNIRYLEAFTSPYY